MILVIAFVGFSKSFNANPFSDQFEKTLSTLGFGESVLRRHCITFDGPLEQYFSSALDQDIARAVLGDLRGVHVLGLPFGAGKSTAVRRVLAQLQNESKISGVLPITNAYNVPEGQSIEYSVFSFLHLNPTTQLSSYLPDAYATKPLVLLFEQFERAQYRHMIKPFIVSLAEESRIEKKFVVLLVLTDPVFTDAILGWNGGEKFSRVGSVLSVGNYRWSYEQLAQLLDEQHKEVSNREQLLRLATVAGTPGFLLGAVAQHLKRREGRGLVAIRNLEQHARELNASWERFSWQEFHYSDYL